MLGKRPQVKTAILMKQSNSGLYMRKRPEVLVQWDSYGTGGGPDFITPIELYIHFWNSQKRSQCSIATGVVDTTGYPILQRINMDLFAFRMIEMTTTRGNHAKRITWIVEDGSAHLVLVCTISSFLHPNEICTLQTSNRNAWSQQCWALKWLSGTTYDSYQ